MADKILGDVRKLVPENVTRLLPAEELDPAVLFLLQQVQDTMTKDGNYAEALKAVEGILEITWEELNTGHWSKVPPGPRQLYTAAAIVKIDALLRSYQQHHADRTELLHTAVKTADLGILLGAPLSGGDFSMTCVAGLLSKALSSRRSGSDPQEVLQHAGNTENTSVVIDNIPGVRGHVLNSLDRPSLEGFRASHFSPRIPVKLTGCITHWPALILWRDINYLKKVAGARTVPIELGAHYVHPAWSQKLMTVAEFIEAHIVPQLDENIPVGYLAQHPLFEQVPELMSDISEPEYCCLSDSVDDTAVTEETDINAWFGPKGTVSPLHYDPKHNLLAQVVGEKRIILYHPNESENLYPHEGSFLNNTAQVNPEEPDYKTFPNYKNSDAWECHLKQGEMLYIPPKWWHHVRSLSTSFSVSFWWT